MVFGFLIAHATGVYFLIITLAQGWSYGVLPYAGSP
jgi:hypothetical protein